MQVYNLLAAPVPDWANAKEVKYPRKQKEGPGMDYSSVAFPKPPKKKKRKR